MGRSIVSTTFSLNLAPSPLFETIKSVFLNSMYIIVYMVKLYDYRIGKELQVFYEQLNFDGFLLNFSKLPSNFDVFAPLAVQVYISNQATLRIF